GDRRGGADGDRAGAHHRVVELAHRERAHVEVDVGRRDRLAAGGDVATWRGDEGDLGRVLAGGRFGGGGDQPHAQRAGDADRLERGQRGAILVDRRLQLGAVIADIGRIDEDRGDAGGDHRGRQRADAGDLQLVDQVAGGEHRPAITVV